MNKQHYEHVSQHFDLGDIDDCNKATEWEARHEGMAIISHLVVITVISRHEYETTYEITCAETNKTVFFMFPSKQFAEEVLQYIKDTEVLFV